MRLRTLGELRLEGSDFKRSKPLLLLAYLCLEGPKERRHLAELFWPGGADPMGNLATVLARLKTVGERVWVADDLRVWTTLPCDALELFSALEKESFQEAYHLYRGRFLEGFYLKEVGSELEEWVYNKRETIASKVRTAQLKVAEKAASQSDFAQAAKLAEQAYLLSGAAEPSDEELERMYRLLRAGSSHLAAEVKKEAQSFGLGLELTIEEAQQAVAAEAVTPHNLMPQATPFVGRETEVAVLGDRLSHPHCRLLSIVGPGGIGKTRLAIEVAREQLVNYPEGVYFVSLVPVSSPSQVAHAVSDALDLTLHGQETPQVQLIDHLKNKTMLLVLDNLEHLLDDLSLLRALLKQAPKLKVLVTSRQRLHLQAEHVFDLDGLQVAEQAEDIERYDAVKLFLQSARQHHAGFVLDAKNAQTVNRICHLLGGMPLALELAATWLRVLSVDDIAAEIEKGIDFLEVTTRDLSERHRSIRAVFDYSWQLLTQEEQALLRKLAVFRGGFQREAAADVAGVSLPVLAGMVDKSLLRVGPGGRYRRHPLMIQYMQEKLAEHPEEQVQAEARHGRYYLELARKRVTNLKSIRWKESFKEDLTALQEERANIRAAWHWAAEQERVEALKQCAQVLPRIYGNQEAVELLSFASSRLSDANPEHQATLAYILIELGHSQLFLGSQQEGIKAAEHGLALIKALEDNEGILKGLSVLASSNWLNSDFWQSKHLGEEGLALARRLGREDYVGAFLVILALVLKEFDDLPDVERFYREGLAEIRQLNIDPQDLAFFLHYYAFYLLHNGDVHYARALERESLGLFIKLDNKGFQCGCLDGLGVAAFKLGELDEAEALLQESLALAEQVHAKFMQAYILSNLAKVAITRRDYAWASRQLKRSFQIGLSIKNTFNLLAALVSFAELRVAQGHPLQAAEWLSLVAHHPGAERHDRMEAKQVLERLHDRVPAEALAAATRNNRDSTLERLVTEVLAEL